MKVPSLTLLLLAARNAYGDLGHSIQDVWLGCHKQRTSSMILPQVLNAWPIRVLRFGYGRLLGVVSP